jgi:tripartite-type tricarboxylate transporter receptor subunit TctC
VELGMPVNYKDINSSRIFFVPLGTSQAIVDGVAARMTRLLNDPEIKGWAEENGLVDAILTGPAAKASQDGLYKLMKENDDIVKTYGG